MIENKSVIAIVPARGGSKGIKLKNLVKINGKHLVEIVGQLINKLSFIDRAIVSTDHKKIAEVSALSGLDAPFLRPKKLSTDFVADIPVLQHALLEVEKIDKKKYDIIIMLQPTSPLRTPKQVSDAVMKLIYGEYDSLMTISKTDSKAHPLKQLIFDNNQIKNYDERGKHIISRQELSTLYHKNGVAYVFTRECILKQGTIIGDKATALIIDEPVVNIDNLWDVKLAEWLTIDS